jgi:predicted acylesterase/phospholipase RssA
MFMPDRIHYTLDGSANPPVPDPVCADGLTTGERMFGVALSGGGSRAAVFAAAGLEALWEHGLLEQITHVSSVSGGSMASSFLVANKPECDRLTGEEEREKCWRAFFADFQDAMRRNYINRAELRQLMPNRTLSPTRRALSMQEEFDKQFLRGKTFSEIEARPAAGGQPARPVLLINGTSYDAGRRFVFANACFPESAPQPTNGARSSRSQAAAHAALQRDGLRAMSFSSDGCARPVPGDFPVSLAVATSAAFPGLMGPVTIEVPDACRAGEPHWWHLGDGGIIENTGIDSLQELVLRDRAVGGDLDRVFLLSLDAGKKVTASSRSALRNTDMWTTPAGVSTVVAAPRTVARAYHDLFWRDMRAILEQDGIDFGSIVLEYTMANLDRWPESCAQRTRPPDRADFEAITTDLKISTCHADLLVLAAHRIVHEQLNGNAGQHLERLGIPVRRVDE